MLARPGRRHGSGACARPSDTNPDQKDTTLHIFHSPDFTDTGIDFDTVRKAPAVATELHRRLGEAIEFVVPTPLTGSELALAHDAEYIDAVRTGKPGGLARSNGIGWDPQLYRAVCMSNGGVRDAVLRAWRTGQITGSLSSGLHHAGPHGGNGYCTFNGLAIAAKVALDDGARRVVILDFDAHAGGGTAAIIDGVAGIEQYDVSVSRFDGYADTANARLVWSHGSTYLDDIAAMLGSIDDPHRIDVVIYNAGMDPHEQAGGVYGITTEVIARREQMVFQWAALHRVPVAWVLAGGYTGSIDVEELASLHCLTAEAALAAQTSDSPTN